MALALAGIVAVALYRYRFSHVLRSAILWLLIAVALALGYTYRTELRSVADRVLAQFLPGRAVTKGRTVQIARGAGGSFSVVGQVNGARISMVLDTGASAVVLTHEAARAAGLPLEVLKYSVNVDTANGLARAAPVTLDRVSIGGTHRAVRTGSRRLARRAAHESARDELSQPPGELGGARRPAAAARLPVVPSCPIPLSIIRGGSRESACRRARESCRRRSRGGAWTGRAQAGPRKAR